MSYNSKRSQGSLEPVRLFVGGLPDGVTDQELKDQFLDFGNINNIELKEREGKVISSSIPFFNESNFQKGKKNLVTLISLQVMMEA